MNPNDAEKTILLLDQILNTIQSGKFTREEFHFIKMWVKKLTDEVFNSPGRKFILNRDIASDITSTLPRNAVINGKPPTIEYLKLNEIVEKYKTSKPTIYRLIKNENFPKGDQFSPQVKLWRSYEVEEWFSDKNKEDRKDLLTE